MAARKVPAGRAVFSLKIRTADMTVEASGDASEDYALMLYRMTHGASTPEQKAAVEAIKKAYAPKKEPQA